MVEAGSKALKFGDNDLVLGLNKNGSLTKWRQKFGGKGYGGFKSKSDKFVDEIDDAMNQADKIRFNLDGVDLNKVNSSSGITYKGKPANGYTNYELWKLKNNKELLSKTVFYLNNKIVKSPF